MTVLEHTACAAIDAASGVTVACRRTDRTDHAAGPDGHTDEVVRTAPEVAGELGLDAGGG